MKKKKVLKKINDIWINLSTEILLVICLLTLCICKIDD